MHSDAEAAVAPSFPSYATLLNEKIIVPSAKTAYSAVERNHLISFLEPHVRRIRVDEDWYRAAHPGVAEAIARGELGCAADHYAVAGFYEHRMPYAIVVDEEWYLDQYPDVRSAVAEGLFASGAQHFADSGYREGRLPYARFTLLPTG
jgi:hypothetical protein